MKTKKKCNILTVIDSAASEIPCTNSAEHDEKHIDSFRIDFEIRKNLLTFNSIWGLFYSFLSAICSGLISVIVKKVSYISASQLLLIRSAGTLLGTLPILVYSVTNVLGEKEDRFLLFLSGLFSITAYFLVIIAYQCLPLAEAAVLISSQPVVTAVFANLCLKETCGIVITFSSILTVLGALLSVRLPEILRSRNEIQINSAYLGGLAASLVSLLLRAFSVVSLRKLKHVNFSVPLLYASLIGIVQSIIINTAAYSFVPSYCGWDQMLCLLVGISGFMETAWRTLAIQKQPAGLVSVEKSSFDIIIAVVLQIVIFLQLPDVYVTSGICLVIVSLGIISFDYWFHTMPKSVLRNIFRKF